ncbi:membrane metallo-endopeptidase-like 1 isoform X2 [Lucilia sericata]|nr:membrane metallo-endopeptidase-like 1 isoform X2 [Lucilia sericata]
MLTYYEACMGEEVYEMGKYLEVIKEYLLNTNFDFWPLLGHMQSYGLNNVIVQHTITRNVDNTLNIILSPVSFDKEESYLPDSQSLMNILYNLDLDFMEKKIKDLYATELQWQQLVKSIRKNDFKQLTVKNITLLYTHLNLQSYLENLLEAELHSVNMITINNAEYFFNLNLKSWTSKELKSLQLYLLIKFLYYLQLDGVKDFEPLECLKDLRNKFDLAINYLYYHDFYKLRAKKFKLVLNSMLLNIRDIMETYFKENHLHLSPEHINVLNNKIQTIKLNIGNLPNGFDFKTIQTYYQDIPQLDRKNYNKNHLLLLKHRFRKSLLYERNQTHDITVDYTYPSPFYLLTKNMIVLPFATFQLPLFHYKQTPLQQLSLFGFVLAHELTHAVDNIGIQYDHQGYSLTQTSAILNHPNFSESLICLQKQKPTNYIHERIADIFGVRVVYRAYLQYYAQRQKDDWRKEFFMNLAQFFCNKSYLKFIEHDPDPVRLQQIVKNFLPFAETYGCSVDSAMHPKNKCRLY